MKTWLSVLLVLVSMRIYATDNIVNVYNWTGYMPPQVLKEFTAKTGIKVNASYFDGNETLFAKLANSNNHSGYDVVVPSADYVTRMRDAGMLQTINHTRLKHLNDITPGLLNKPFDPHNQYSIPYFWGLTGIIVNRRYFPNLKIHTWADLWQPALKNQILMLDSATEPFEIALKVIGYPPNSENPQQIKAAYYKLIALLPNVKVFNITAPQSIIGNGDVSIGVVYNGDAFPMMQLNNNLHFIFPHDGAFAWIDNISIPKNAPHLNNAYTFINFIMQPKIAAQIAESAGYSSPNRAAIKLLPKTMRDSKILYPSKSIIAKATFEKDKGKANGLYQHYWFLLKLNGSS